MVKLDDSEKNMRQAREEVATWSDARIKNIQLAFSEKLAKVDELAKELPEVYKPESLQESEPETRVVCYAIGTEDVHDSFSMVDGPTPNLIEMLNSIGNEGEYILKLGTGAHEILYKWDDDDYVWRKL